MFCTSIATRFVPFASDDSNPRNIRTGKVKVEPPPAVTFIKPAIIPTPKSINSAIGSEIVIHHKNYLSG